MADWKKVITDADIGSGSSDVAAGNHTHSYLPSSGGTLTSDDPLVLYSSTNGTGVGIKFSDHTGRSQYGNLEYFHGDGSSYGSNESFRLTGTEPTLTFLVDGKLMFDEGIYSKPASGTGAGTRKDSNWDTAYTYSQVGHLPLSGGTLTGNLTTNGQIYSSSSTLQIRGAGNTPIIYGVSGATYLYAGNNATTALTLQAGYAIAGVGFAYGAVNNYTKIIDGSTGALTGTSATFSDDINIDSGYAYKIGTNRFLLYNGNTFLGDIDNAGGDVYIREDGSTKMTITGGNVGIGTTSPSQKLDVDGHINVNGSIIGSHSSWLDIYTDTSNGSDTKATRIGGGGDVSAGRGAFATFYGTDHGSKPGDLYLTPGGGDCIINSGNVGIGTTSPSKELHVDGVGQFDSGVKLNSSSTTLDDYEEGSWTPTMNSSWTHSGTSTNNRYTKIGNVVTLWGHLSNVSSGTSSGNITITGLPFSVSHSATGGTAMLNSVNFNTKANNVSPFVNTSEDLFFYESGGGSAWSKMSNADLSSGDDIYFQIAYETSE